MKYREIELTDKLFGDSVQSSIQYELRKRDPKEFWPYQEDLISQFSDRTFLVAPTGAGKTLMMLAKVSEWVKRGFHVAIVTPKLLITEGVEAYTKDDDWSMDLVKRQVNFSLSQGIIIQPEGAFERKVQEATRILTKDIPGVVVCAYPTFLKVYDNLGRDSKIAVIIDEAHHSSSGVELNRLGEVVERLIDHNRPLMLATATPFRADGRPLISNTEKFKILRRSLYEHYTEGFCPNLAIKFGFLNNLVKDLPEYYIREFEKNPIPTLMLVKNKGQAYKLYKKLKKKDKWKILNLGSRDGRTLVSTKNRNEIKRLVYEGQTFDIVIAIRMMDEGADWPWCSAVFFPSLPTSFVSVVQRFGRALRKKSPDHPSPDTSRILFCEQEILEKSGGDILKFAIRLKCLWSNVELFGKSIFKRKRIINPEKRIKAVFETYAKFKDGHSAEEFFQLAKEAYWEAGIQIDDKELLKDLIENRIISLRGVKQKIRFLERGDQVEVEMFVKLVEETEVKELIKNAEVANTKEHTDVIAGGYLGIVDEKIEEYKKTREVETSGKEFWAIFPKIELAAQAARDLGITTKEEYLEKHHLDSRLPKNPWIEYQRDWKGWYKFLNVAAYSRLWAVRKIVVSAKINSEEEYHEAVKEHSRLPMYPENHFKDWPGYNSVIGTKEVKFRTKGFYKYPTWKKKVKQLGFSICKDYVTGYKIDPRLHSAPDKYYEEWEGWTIALGHDKREFYTDFREASIATYEAGVVSNADYFRRAVKVDPKLPDPRVHFPDQFDNFYDYIMFGSIRTYEKFIEICTRLQIKDRDQYMKVRNILVARVARLQSVRLVKFESEEQRRQYIITKLKTCDMLVLRPEIFFDEWEGWLAWSVQMRRILG